MSFIIKIEIDEFPQKDTSRCNGLLVLRTFRTTLSASNVIKLDRKRWITKALARLFLFLFLMLFTQCDNNQPQLIVYESNHTDVQTTNLKLENK